MPGAINPALRRKALRSFKQRGYTVHVKALETILQAFNSPEQSDDLPAFLEKIFEHLSRPGATEDGILTLSVAEEIASRVAQSDARDEGNADAAFEVIDVFAAPAWLPPADGASATGASTKPAASSTGIAGPPLAKAELFRARYNLIRAKTLRNPDFTPPASGILARKSASPYLELTGIESLAGTHGDRLVLGMLTQLEEGSWYLEDLHGHIKLDLSAANITAGFHTDCSFVIAQGEHVEEEGGDCFFRVSAMGTPPLEEREASLSALGRHANLFGGNFDVSQLERMRKMEAEEPDAMILLLSDVALDNPRVLVGIRHILQGYLEDEVVPKVVVLMGSFLSHPFGQHVDDLALLTSKFTQLGRLIAEEFPTIAASSAFVLVPSLQDPGPGNVLPRPPLPPMVTAGFVDALGSAEHVHLATNPCRMRYLSQELIVLREDLMQKMVRHCAVKPDLAETPVMSEHLIKSVIDQAHLSPLPLSVRPTIWGCDHALRLFPTPHVLAIADRVECYVCKYGGALGVNPGSFATDFSFCVYLPAERRAQQCSIDSERAPEGEPESPPREESESEDFGSDSDSGHSMHSLIRAGRLGSDDDDDDDDDGSGLDIDLDDVPKTAAVEQQPAKKAPLRDTQSVVGDSEPMEEMQTEAAVNGESAPVDIKSTSEPVANGSGVAQAEANNSKHDTVEDGVPMQTESQTAEVVANELSMCEDGQPTSEAAVTTNGASQAGTSNPDEGATEDGGARMQTESNEPNVSSDAGGTSNDVSKVGASNSDEEAVEDGAPMQTKSHTEEKTGGGAPMQTESNEQNVSSDAGGTSNDVSKVGASNSNEEAVEDGAPMQTESLTEEKTEDAKGKTSGEDLDEESEMQIEGKPA